MPLGPYRGAGRPEAIYLIERLIEVASRATGIDRVTLRRRNLIPSSAMPYKAPNWPVYDSGEFEAVLDKALALADWNGFAARRAASRAPASCAASGSAASSRSPAAACMRTADLRFEADGKVALRLGAQAIGQGHLTTFPPVVATAARHRGERGAGRGRQRRGAGRPADGRVALDDDGRRLDGDRLRPVDREGAADREPPVRGGRRRHRVRRRAVSRERHRPRDPDPRARRSARARCPDCRRISPAGSTRVATFQSPQMSFPNGCHVCEVEIDPDTGIVAVVGYAAVDDVGSVDPPDDRGRADPRRRRAGARAGARRADAATARTASSSPRRSWTTSCRARTICRAADGHHACRARPIPLGVKGAGRIGRRRIAALGDERDPRRAGGRRMTHLDLPASPQRVWEARPFAESLTFPHRVADCEYRVVRTGPLMTGHEKSSDYGRSKRPTVALLLIAVAVIAVAFIANILLVICIGLASCAETLNPRNV